MIPLNHIKKISQNFQTNLIAAIVSRLPNQRSTLISFPPSTAWMSRDMCLKDLWRVPLGPFTVTSRDLKLTVTKQIKIKTYQRSFSLP
jgi:hypothetical protein